MSRPLMFWLAILFVFAGCALIWQIQRVNRRTVEAPKPVSQAIPPEALTPTDQPTEFELLDQTGKRVNSNEFAGKVWAASFFFSRCPSKCYQQNIQLQQLYAKYAKQGLELVSITCDPKYDTPVVLASYAARFNADAKTWKFLTPSGGDEPIIGRIGNEMGIPVDATQATHTDRVVLYDQGGKPQGAYSVMQPDQFRALDEKIDTLLAADKPEPANDDVHESTTSDST